MLANGINEGWLDRSAYLPVVLKAFGLLQARVDASGDVSDIQPPGTGPDCAVTASNDPGVNVTYGVGAFLLAASEVSKLPGESLAGLEAAEGAPVGEPPLPRTWFVALPSICGDPSIVLTNLSSKTVHVTVEPQGGGDAPVAADVLPGETRRVPVATPPTPGVTSVVTVRASGDIAVTSAAPCGPMPPQKNFSPVGRAGLVAVGVASPIWTALGRREESVGSRPGTGSCSSAGTNARPRATCQIEIFGPENELVERTTLTLDPGEAAIERVFVRSGSTWKFANEAGGAVVPFTGPLPSVYGVVTELREDAAPRKGTPQRP